MVLQEGQQKTAAKEQNTASDYLDRVRRFSLSLQPEAERLDTDGDLLAEKYARFVSEGLHVGWSPRQPLTGREFCEVLALLAETSGAFAFVALQQLVANLSLAGRVLADADWPRVGVAFGHLRNRRGASPVWDGCLANGTVPWLTGAGIFDSVVLGMRGPDGAEVYALAEASDRPAFRHNAPLDLMAGSGTRTVSVLVRDLRVGEDAVLRADPPGTMERNDMQSVLYQTPLMVGCVRACRKLLDTSSHLHAAQRNRCDAVTEDLLRRVYAAFDGCTPEEGQQIRAELGDFSVRLARLTVMACGGVGLVRGHPGQRLYCEALLYSLMAQTTAIVNQAFHEVMR